MTSAFQYAKYAERALKCRSGRVAADEIDRRVLPLRKKHQWRRGLNFYFTRNIDGRSGSYRRRDVHQSSPRRHFVRQRFTILKVKHDH